MRLSHRGRQVVASAGVLAGSVTLGVGLGAPAEAVDSEWSNPTAINGVDASTATRNINVSGLQGTVSDVEVTLVGVSHQFPTDMDIMLRGPGGQRVVLVSDACSQWDVEVVDFTIDDEAASSFPLANATPCAAGSYRPTDHDTGTDTWQVGGPTGSTLAAFDGSGPNGTWTLEVRDDAPGDATKLAGGWQLHLSTSTPLTCNGLVVDVDLAKGEKPTSDADVIRGTAGNDTINALGGNDVVCGLGGDDLIQGGPGDDVILGGAGNDTASYSSAVTPVTASLATGNPQFTGGATGTDTLKQLENLRGGAGSDTLTGNSLDNDLLGLAGLDDLRGAAGADKLIGGPDTDSCNGGVDVDTAATCETVVNVP